MNLAIPLPRRAKGVTLAELLVVIVILSIVATIVVPSLAPLSEFALDQTAKQVAYTLEFASREAQRTGKVTVVSFNTTAKTIEVYQPIYNPALSGRTPVKHPLEKRDFIVQLDSGRLTGASLAVSASFSFEDGSTASEIAFDPLGQPGKPISATAVAKLTDLPHVWRGQWQSNGMSYTKDDNVVYRNVEYIVLSNHNSNLDFQTDLATGRWTQRTKPAQIQLSARSTYDIYVASNTGTPRMYKR